MAIRKFNEQIGNIPDEFLNKGKPAENFREMNRLGGRSIQLLRQIKEKESNLNKAELEQIAKDTVYNIFLNDYKYDIRDSIVIDAHIVSEYSRDLKQDVKPGLNKQGISRYKEEHAEDTELLDEIDKRDIVNALTQGFSLDFQEHIIMSTENILPQEIAQDYIEFLNKSKKTHDFAPSEMVENVEENFQYAQFEGKNSINYVGNHPVGNWHVNAFGTSLIILIHEILKGVFEILAIPSLKNYEQDPNQKAKQREALDMITDSFYREHFGLKHGSQLVSRFKAFISDLENNLIKQGKILQRNPNIVIYLLSSFYSEDAKVFLNVTESLFQAEAATKVSMDYFSEKYMEIYNSLKEPQEEDQDDFITRMITSNKIKEEPTKTTSNLDLDTILDKISKSGEGSLTSEEREYLSNRKI